MNMWPDWLKTIQLKARYLFGIWLLGGLLLFIPSNVAGIFRVDALRDNYGLWIGLATMAGFCFWLVQMYPAIKDWKYERAKRNDLLNSIFYLPLEQKAVLAIILHRDNSIISKPISDSNIKSLWSRGIIEAMGNFEECFNNGPCRIKNHVWRFIRKDKNKNKILTEDIKRQFKKDD